MNRRRTAIGAVMSVALIAGAITIATGPAGAATVQVECVGADPASEQILAVLGDGTIDAGVSGRIEPTEVVAGSNDLDFFVGLELPQSLIDTAVGAGITSADLRDVEFTIAAGSGVTGPDIVATPADQTVSFTSGVPDIEVGPFGGTFDVTAANFETVSWNLTGASMQIGVSLGGNPVNINIVCDQVGTGALVQTTLLPPVDASGPVVGPLEAVTDEDTPVEIDLTEGISDGPYETDLSTLAIVGDPSNGTAVLGDNGIVTYTPDAGFTGEDQFAYEVCSIDVVETTTTTEATTTTSTPPVDDVAVGDVVRAQQGRERFCNSNLVTVTVNPVGGETTTTTAGENPPPAAQPQAQPATFTG
jgi:hypothetical protein